MKKIIFIILGIGLMAITPRAFAAVSFDHIEVPSLSTTGTIDMAFTVSGNANPAIVISGFGAVATNETYTITFNGAAATQTIYYDTTSTVHRAFLAIMRNMGSGTHTLHIANASGDLLGLVAAEYDGVSNLGLDFFSVNANSEDTDIISPSYPSNSWLVVGGRVESGTNNFPNSPPNNGRTLNNSVGAVMGDTDLNTTSTVKVHATGGANMAILGIELLPTGGGGGTPNPVAKFLYPQNSTSTFIHDFNAFSYVATNTDSVAHTYRFYITYDTTSTFDFAPITLSRNVDYSFGAGKTHYLNIPKTGYLATSTTYYAEICSTYDGILITFTCQDQIVFKTGDYPFGFQIDTSQAGWFGASSTEPAILQNNILPGLSDTQYCDVSFYSPSSWFCWLVAKAKEGLDTAGEYIGSGIRTVASSTTVIFPVGVFYTFNADFQSINTTTTNPEIYVMGTGTIYKNTKTGNYFRFSFLTSSTVRDAENKTGFDWETLLVNLIYAFDGVLILAVAFKLLHQSSNITKK